MQFIYLVQSLRLLFETIQFVENLAHFIETAIDAGRQTALTLLHRAHESTFSVGFYRAKSHFLMDMLFHTGSLSKIHASLIGVLSQLPLISTKQRVISILRL